MLEQPFHQWQGSRSNTIPVMCIRSMLIVLLALLAKNICAAVLMDGETRFTFREEITLKDVETLEQAILAGNNIRQILFVDVHGTKSEGSKVYAKLVPLIRNRSLDTIARGACWSSCATAFLAGKNRILLSPTGKYRTALLLHAFREVSKERPIIERTLPVLEQIRRDLNGQISETHLEKLLHSGREKAGLYIPGAPLPGTTAFAIFCDGTEANIPSGCAPIETFSLETANIVNYTSSPIKSWVYLLSN